MPHINQLNAALNGFKGDIARDRAAQDILDVAVVQFSEDFNILQDFIPIANLNPLRLIAGSSANYSVAIHEALKMADAKTRYGGSSHKPWIVLIASAAPADDISAVTSEVQGLQGADKLRFMALSADGGNSASLKQLTDVVFRINDTNFVPFFGWISQCMGAIARTKPGEKPQLPNLEGNVYRDR